MMPGPLPSTVSVSSNTLPRASISAISTRAARPPVSVTLVKSLVSTMLDE